MRLPELVANVAPWTPIFCLTSVSPNWLSASAPARVTHLSQHRGQRRVRTCEMWLQADGLAQRLRRLRKLVHLFQNGAERVIRFDVVGFQFNRFSQILDCGGKFSLLATWCCPACNTRPPISDPAAMAFFISAIPPGRLSFNFRASPRS